MFLIFFIYTNLRLIYMYCNTDVLDKDCWTPIHYACDGGNKELVQYLVENILFDAGKLRCICNIALVTH